MPIKSVFVAFRKTDHGDGIDIMGVYDDIWHANMVAVLSQDWRHTTEAFVRKASYISNEDAERENET